MDMVVAVSGESLSAVDLAGKVGGDRFFFVIGSEGFECAAIEIAASKGRRDRVNGKVSSSSRWRSGKLIINFDKGKSKYDKQKNFIVFFRKKDQRDESPVVAKGEKNGTCEDKAIREGGIALQINDLMV